MESTDEVNGTAGCFACVNLGCNQGNVDAVLSTVFFV